MSRCFLSLFTLLLSASLSAKPLQLDVSAESAILMNADTGAILYEKNAHLPCYPASVTKIATAAYVLNCTQADLDQEIAAAQDDVGSVTEDAKRRAGYTLPSYWLVSDASHMGIKRGEVLTLRDLLYGMMVASADDASNVIARHIGGTVPLFMEQVNTYLSSLGCKETSFNNPHGLHHPKHQTTAFDMALLTRQALKHPLFCEMVTTTRWRRPKTNKQEATTLLQTNRLLLKGQYYYPKAIGVKTGYTSAAQRTFVAAARDGNRVLIAVLFKVKDKREIFTESARLFEAAFAEEKIAETLLPEGPQAFVLNLEGAAKPVKTFTAESLSLEYFPAEEPHYRSVVVWDEISLPIGKGARVGELQLLTPQGDLLAKVVLYSQEKVSASWGQWLSSFFR